jgi:hypothetical protein
LPPSASASGDRLNLPLIAVVQIFGDRRLLCGLLLLMAAVHVLSLWSVLVVPHNFSSSGLSNFVAPRSA